MKKHETKLTHSLSNWLTESLIHSFTHSHCHSLTHSLTDWLIRPTRSTTPAGQGKREDANNKRKSRLERKKKFKSNWKENSSQKGEKSPKKKTVFHGNCNNDLASVKQKSHPWNYFPLSSLWVWLKNPKVDLKIIFHPQSQKPWLTVTISLPLTHTQTLTH